MDRAKYDSRPKRGKAIKTCMVAYNGSLNKQAVMLIPSCLPRISGFTLIKYFLARVRFKKKKVCILYFRSVIYSTILFLHHNNQAVFLIKHSLEVLLS